MGGNAGIGTNTQGSVKSFGGNGINIERGDLGFSGNFDPSSITINSGTFTGGGGTVSLFNESITLLMNKHISILQVHMVVMDFVLQG